MEILKDNLWFILAVINSALAGIFVKYYITTNNICYLYGAIFCNVFLIYNYVKIFNNNSIVISYPYIKVLSIVLVAITGVLIFNEKCSNYTICGIIFGLLSIVLLSVKDEK